MMTLKIIINNCIIATAAYEKPMPVKPATRKCNGEEYMMVPNATRSEREALATKSAIYLDSTASAIFGKHKTCNLLASYALVLPR